MRAAIATASCFLLLGRTAVAQRADEDHGKVVYEDSRGALTDLGLGFNPLLSADGKVIFIRGRKFDYGDPFDCGDKDTKNWVAAYDPATKSEKVLFDRALPFETTGIVFCIFEQMQLSPDGSILYLVSPVYATSGSLAIVSLRTGRVKYVGGVDEVYVIQSGLHKGDLVYQQRNMTGSGADEHPYYPWVHAGADGAQIKVLAEEWIEDGNTPQLMAYLLSINGTITVHGRTFP